MSHSLRSRNYPQFTEEHDALRKTVRDWATNALYPHAEEWEEAGIFPREVFKQAGDLGLLGIRVPEAYGGLGLDWWYTVCYAEELVHCGMAGTAMGLLVMHSRERQEAEEPPGGELLPHEDARHGHAHPGGEGEGSELGEGLAEGEG